jgi:hypothetical protein
MGVGYEKLQILHKLAGRLIFICSTIHVGYFSESWLFEVRPELIGSVYLVKGGNAQTRAWGDRYAARIIGLLGPGVAGSKLAPRRETLGAWILQGEYSTIAI